MSNKIPFNRFGPMYDCGRNAVLNLDSIKKLVDICADCGYTSFFLYTEDVFEVDGHPYFGHGRGRYSKAELKEIDTYCNSKGIELIPCIQTLAHLDAIMKWGHYKAMRDYGNTLLVGDERVYELIDKMFSTLSQCVSTKMINIGMDEAVMVGRGRYYNLHGDCNRFELLVEHVKKVAEIAAKYGYRVSMWSDMFYRLAKNGEYDELKTMIPDNVELICWEYYSTTESYYDGKIEEHQKMNSKIWFAGALGSTRGFTSTNGYSIRCTTPAIDSCISHEVKDVMLTSWGDDGGDCSRFSTLPSLFYLSEYAKGNKSMKSIKEKFKEMFDISWDAFMLLDLFNGQIKVNPSKYMLYNDLFVGLLDTTIPADIGEKYAKFARKLARYRKHEKWGYLFETQYTLCRVLELKANLGNELRDTYKAGDKEELAKLLLKCKEVRKRTAIFYKTFKKQWFIENKPFGIDVQNVRLGGLIARIEHCIELLSDYLAGKTNCIDELEIESLDIAGTGAEKKPRLLTLDYEYTVSPNVILFNNYFI